MCVCPGPSMDCNRLDADAWHQCVLRADAASYLEKAHLPAPSPLQRCVVMPKAHREAVHWWQHGVSSFECVAVAPAAHQPPTAVSPSLACLCQGCSHPGQVSPLSRDVGGLPRGRGGGSGPVGAGAASLPVEGNPLFADIRREGSKASARDAPAQPDTGPWRCDCVGRDGLSAQRSGGMGWPARLCLSSFLRFSRSTKPPPGPSLPPHGPLAHPLAASTASLRCMFMRVYSVGGRPTAACCTVGGVGPWPRVARVLHAANGPDRPPGTQQRHPAQVVAARPRPERP
jgi:hypothetical protein